MDSHNNARLTPRGREDMVLAVVDSGLCKAEAVRQFNTTWKTGDKWVQALRPTPLATAEAVEAKRRARKMLDQVRSAARGPLTSAVL